MNTTEKQAYQTVIAGLQAARERIDGTIDLLSKILSNGGPQLVATGEEPKLPKPGKIAKPKSDRSKKAAYQRRWSATAKSPGMLKRRWLRDFVMETAKEFPQSLTVKTVRDQAIAKGHGDLNDISVRSSIGRLASHGHLRKIAPGEYALVENPPQDKEPLSPLQDMIEREVAAVGNAVRLRDLTTQIASKLGDKAPSMETIGSTLVTLTRKGKIRRVGLGLYSK